MFNSKSAIVLDRPRFGHDGEFRAVIDRNQIHIHDYGYHQRSGINVNGNFPTSDYMRIDSNYILVDNGGLGGYITPFLSVSVNSAENFRITRNTLRSNNTRTTGYNRWGIFLSDGASNTANGNLLWGNDISGVGVHDGGFCALHAQNAGPWSICSNVTDLSYRGYHFMGSCGKSTFGLNLIKDHSIAGSNEPSTGLMIQGLGGDNGYLGVQECQDNYWNPTSYNNNGITAVLAGEGLNPAGSNTVTINEFAVQDINDPHQAPTDRRPANGWFITGSCLEPTGCVSTTVNIIDEHDEWTRATWPQPFATAGVEEWQNVRAFMSKLMRYPALVQGSYDEFYFNWTSHSAGLFARFDSLLSLTLARTSDQENMNMLDTQIRTVQSQIADLDAAIGDLATVNTAYWTQKSAFSEQLTGLVAQRENQLSTMTNWRDQVLDICEQFNKTLPENEIYEQNQKTLNALLIQKARDVEFSETDKQSLHSIAAQCVQVAGWTKDAAIGLLPAMEGNSYLKEDPGEYDCAENRNVNGVIGTAKILLVSPNPADEKMLIQFSEPFSGIVNILDVTGRNVFEKTVSTETPSLEISVVNFKPGMYFISGNAQNGHELIKTKFIVRH